MKGNWLGAVTITALALSVTPACAQHSIKIGFVSTFSGQQAPIGEDMRRAVELAKEHLGGKAGHKELQIIYEDDQFNPDVGRQKSEKLVRQDKVDFVAGYIWSDVLLASLRSVVEIGNTILVSANAGPSQIAGELCHKNFFATSTQNDQPAMAMGSYLNEKNVKSLYLVGPNYPDGKDTLAGLKRTYKGEIAGEDYTSWPDQIDFSAELARIAAARPDGIFAFYPGEYGVQFLRQYAQVGLKGKIPLYQVSSIDAITLPQQGDIALGILGAQEWTNDLPNEQNRRFVRDFRKKYGTYPSFYGAQSYDAIMLIASAVNARNGDVLNREAILSHLRVPPDDFKSVRGDFRFNHNQFPTQNFYIQETIKDAVGMLTVKTVATAVRDGRDPYYHKCPITIAFQARQNSKK